MALSTFGSFTGPFHGLRSLSTALRGLRIREARVSGEPEAEPEAEPDPGAGS